MEQENSDERNAEISLIGPDVACKIVATIRCYFERAESDDISKFGRYELTRQVSVCFRIYAAPFTNHRLRGGKGDGGYGQRGCDVFRGRKGRIQGQRTGRGESSVGRGAVLDFEHGWIRDPPKRRDAIGEGWQQHGRGNSGSPRFSASYRSLCRTGQKEGVCLCGGSDFPSGNSCQPAGARRLR